MCVEHRYGIVYDVHRKRMLWKKEHMLMTRRPGKRGRWVWTLTKTELKTGCGKWLSIEVPDLGAHSLTPITSTLHVREKHWSLVSRAHPNQASNSQPSHELWPRIKPTTVCCMEWRVSTSRAVSLTTAVKEQVVLSGVLFCFYSLGKDTWPPAQD